MKPDIDFHAAFSLWSSRATQVCDFAVGDWKGVIYRAHPDDLEQDLARLVCALDCGGRFAGLIIVRQRSPQLSGTIITPGSPLRVEAPSIEVPSFSGDAAELAEFVRQQLEALPQK